MIQFLNELPEQDRAKVDTFLEILSQEGPHLRRPFSDHVQGPLRELRIRIRAGHLRILYFFLKKEYIILVHAFVKKTSSIPARELATVQTRMSDFMIRAHQGELLL